MSPALREVLPQFRKGFGRLGKIVGLLVVAVSLAGAAIVLSPPSSISHERASALGLGLFAIGIATPLVGSALRIMLATRSSPRAE